jgi:hypothetical protein
MSEPRPINHRVNDFFIWALCSLLVHNWDEMDQPGCARWLLELSKTMLMNPKSMKAYCRDAIYRSSE